MSTDNTPELKKRKRGRPRKSEVQSKKTGNRVARGRPPGDAAIINEYKARMLASPKSKHVLDKIFEAALEDEHKHQAAAWKIITDRIVPASYFDKDRLSGGRPSIDIRINVPHGSDISGDSSSGDDAIDAEYTEVEQDRQDS